MRYLLALLICSALEAATVNVAAPTGVAATDKAALTTANSASGSGDTVQFSGAGITAHPTCAVAYNSTAMTCSSGSAITNGQKVWAWGIAEGTTVSSGGGTTGITLSAPSTQMIPSGTTVAFGTAYNFTGGSVPALISDHRTYTCATPSTCVLDLGNNTGGMTTTTTRNTMTISNLWIEGCGLNTNTGNSATYFAGFTFTGNQLFNCTSGTSFSGFFLLDFWGWGGGGSSANISNNTFANGGCFTTACDGAFTGVQWYHWTNTTFDSNAFILIEEGMHQNNSRTGNFDGVTTPETGCRFTNNTWTRGHRIFLELQGWWGNGCVVSGNKTLGAGWQTPYWNSWFMSLAVNFFFQPSEGTNWKVQNNVADARNDVAQDGVTSTVNVRPCFEISGSFMLVDGNQCLNLTTAPSGFAAYFTGFSGAILSGMYQGTISNNCWGGFFESPDTLQTNNYYTFGDQGTPTDGGSLPTLTNNATPPNAASCPGVSTTPSITTTSLPAGVTSQPYSFTVLGTGGVPPYTWSISVGALPAGLTIGSATGIISGTPSGSGTTSFTVRVVDNASNAATLATSITVNSAAGVTSDQFTTPPLNAGLWTVVDPVGGSSATVGSGALNIAVAGGALHDPSFGGSNNSVRVIQSVSGNFTAIAKFNSFPTQRYSFEGIVAIQDATNYIYFQIGTDGTSTQVGAVTIIGGATTLIGLVTITPGTFECLSLTQSGTTWNAGYSSDCVNFTQLTGSPFTQSLTVASVGPWAGNYNDSTPATPAFTAVVDYFVSGVTPDMTVTMTHSGSFSQSQVGATYTVTGTNGGGGASNGNVIITSQLPAGLTATAIAGSGWACTLSTLTCSRSDSLAASASYPAITLTVNVAANASTPLVPTSVISGGGETNTANDSVTNSTVITPVVVVPHVVSFTAAGVSSGGFPVISVEDTSGNILGNTPCTSTMTGTQTAYNCNITTLPVTNIRLAYTNGGTGRTVTVSAFNVDGNATSTTSATVYTLSTSPLCPTGFLRNQTIGCQGYMEFPTIGAVTPVDTTQPTVPTGLTAITLQSNSVQLNWTGSQDDIGVVGYRIVKNGTFSGLTSTTVSFVDPAPAKGANTYAIVAFDAANNASTASSPASVTITTIGTGANGSTFNIGGTVDDSGAAVTVPCAVQAALPVAGVPGQCIHNTTTGLDYIWNTVISNWSAMLLNAAQVIAGIQTFTSPPVMSGAGITLASVPTTALATVQGNSTKVQLSSGTTTTNDCVKYDVNGNAVDAGVPCGSGSGSVTSVTIAGTVNQVNVSGTCTITTTGVCTIALPAGLILPGTVNGLTITTTTGTLTIASAKVATINNSLTLAGTDGVTLTFPTTNATIARTDAAQTLTGVQTFATPIAIGSGGTGTASPALTPGTNITSITGTWPNQTINAAPPTRAIAIGIGAPGSGTALTTSSVSSPITIPYSCTIGAPASSKYSVAVGAGDSGTFTVKFWKIAGGTAIPTSGNSINTSGLSLSTGAVVQSSTFSDFTSTTVTANDIMMMAVTAISGTIDSITAVLPCQ